MKINKNILLASLLFILVIILFSTTAFANYGYDAPGFFQGLWDGSTWPAHLIEKLYTYQDLYRDYNNGFFYNLGFFGALVTVSWNFALLLSVIILFGDILAVFGLNIGDIIFGIVVLIGALGGLGWFLSLFDKKNKSNSTDSNVFTYSPIPGPTVTNIREPSKSQFVKELVNENLDPKLNTIQTQALSSSPTLHRPSKKLAFILVITLFIIILSSYNFLKTSTLGQNNQVTINRVYFTTAFNRKGSMTIECVQKNEKDIEYFESQRDLILNADEETRIFSKSTIYIITHDDYIFVYDDLGNCKVATEKIAKVIKY